MIKLKRIYEPAKPDDGYRVLVERLWPRGISKERAALYMWLKEIAPSPELRSWFSHDPAKSDEFRKRYLDELQENEAVTQLRELIKDRDVTLIYATKDKELSSALVLKDFLEHPPSETS